MKCVIPKVILLFSYAIFVAHTLAEPSQEGVNEFIVRHQQHRHAKLLERAKSHDTTTISDNWAGAVQVASPSGFFSSVSAAWTIPSASRPPSATGDGQWALSTWVGIDGDSCSSALFQAGFSSYYTVHSTANETVTESASAWVEWIPAGETPLPEFPVFPGDSVEVFISALNRSFGVVVINNLSRNASETVTISSPSEASELCGTNAEWILEDFEGNGAFVPFADFTNVSFSNCLAKTTTGALVDLNNATLFHLVQNNTALATPTIVSSTELQITYG